MVSQKIKVTVESPSSGVIRKMFEEGAMLKKKYGDDKVFDFSIGNPDLDPPQKVVDAVREIAADTTHLRHGYMPNAGYPETRAAMAAKTASEQGVQIGFENVVMTVGAAGALNVTLKALMNEGDKVIVPCPYFVEYDNYIKNAGGDILRAKTTENFGLDAAEIQKLLDAHTAAIIINSPNNPTGRIYSKNILRNSDVHPSGGAC